MQNDRTANPLYAYQVQGFRTNVRSFFVRNKIYSTIAIISEEGLLSYTTVEGGYNTEMFVNFFKDKVVGGLGVWQF